MPRKTFDYAVIVALKEEGEYFRRVIACGDPGQIDEFTVWPIEDASWDAFGRGLLVVSGAMGFERARASTAAVIAKYPVSLIANLGIAGRVADWLNIGDVVVPRDLFDLTQGGKIGGDQERPDFRHAFSQKRIKSALVTMAETHLQVDSRLMGSINDSLRKRFAHVSLWPAKGLKVVVRPIATVPTVGANDLYRDSISRAQREIVAMEMEAAGVHTALEKADIELVCVRGISDGGDFNKAALEAEHRDENRRLALEAAATVLETVLTLKENENDARAPATRLDLVEAGRLLTPEQQAEIALYETLFSHMVRGPDERPVSNPIAELSALLTSDNYREPIVLLGAKGVGKTTLMTMVQAHAAQPRAGIAAPSGVRSVLVRLSALEIWSSGVLDELRTHSRVSFACQQVSRMLERASGPVVVLIDGLNQTGAHRTPLVAELVNEVLKHGNARLFLSAEGNVDLQKIYDFQTVDVQTVYRIRPVDIDSEHAQPIIDTFAAITGSPDAALIANDIRQKEVRFLDLFILSLFFKRFRSYIYRNKSLAECYGLYCAGVLSGGSGARSAADPQQRLSAVARTAFDILISKDKRFADLNEEAAARLISSHSSVTSFLVARHIIDTLIAAKPVPGKPGNTKEQLKRRLNYVFPADVNSFTKQIMTADRNTERDLIDVLRAKPRDMPTLVRSHLAYLAGRVRRDRRAEMLNFLRQIGNPRQGHVAPQGAAASANRMLRRSIFISRSMLGDGTAALEYAEILLTDREESEFNRGFHLEYYGDAPFEPDGRMLSRDDGEMPCGRTFARLMERIRKQPSGLPPLIELLTVLALVQARNLNGTLRADQRSDVLDLLAGPQLRDRHLLPDKVRGYIERIREDLQVEDFKLSTLLEEWNSLAKIERTGWLRRRRDAVGDALVFWKDVRIESVAEHLIGVLGLAKSFLTTPCRGEELYDKHKIIEMLLVHDLAEARLGDQLPNHTDPKAEEEALWKYGAFSTYPDIGDLWSVPELLQEFNSGKTNDSRIAKDLDRLQFILQARAYSGGMSAEELAQCESASQNISTATVRAIERVMSETPKSPRIRINPALLL